MAVVKFPNSGEMMDEYLVVPAQAGAMFIDISIGRDEEDEPEIKYLGHIG